MSLRESHRVLLDFFRHSKYNSHHSFSTQCHWTLTWRWSVPWTPRAGWNFSNRSSMFAHDLGHLCRGRRIHTSGHSDLGVLSNLGASSNFSWVYDDTTSAACPSQSGNLAITSIIFAVIWDADEPCSVKTAWAPESSFTTFPRSTPLPL